MNGQKLSNQAKPPLGELTLRRNAGTAGVCMERLAELSTPRRGDQRLDLSHRVIVGTQHGRILLMEST